MLIIYQTIRTNRAAFLREIGSLVVVNSLNFFPFSKSNKLAKRCILSHRLRQGLVVSNSYSYYAYRRLYQGEIHQPRFSSYLRRYSNRGYESHQTPALILAKLSTWIPIVRIQISVSLTKKLDKRQQNHFIMRVTNNQGKFPWYRATLNKHSLVCVFHAVVDGSGSDKSSNKL